LIFQSCHCNVRAEIQQCQGFQAELGHFVKNLMYFVNKAGIFACFDVRNVTKQPQNLVIQAHIFTL